LAPGESQSGSGRLDPTAIGGAIADDRGRRVRPPAVALARNPLKLVAVAVEVADAARVVQLQRRAHRGDVGDCRRVARQVPPSPVDQLGGGLPGAGDRERVSELDRHQPAQLWILQSVVRLSQYGDAARVAQGRARQAKACE
jgi:hypothetical protein